MGDTSSSERLWIETGIPRLDRVLGGGLLRGSLMMVLGPPGAGKTVLTQQMAFHHAIHGGAALCLTGYSETHAKLLQHNASLSFFKPELIGEKVQFGNLLDLMRHGPDDTSDAIVATARSQRASLVVIDGFRGLRSLLANDHAVSNFLYSLSAKLGLAGATTVVIFEGDPDDPTRYQEITVSDVIVALRRAHTAGRQRLLLEVLKARGAAPLRGMHSYSISADGLAVYPRFESTIETSGPEWTPGRLRFGIEKLDAMTGGGLNAGTITVAAASLGLGKTSLGLHFATEGARAGEPALFLSLMESPTQLRELGQGLGMDVAAAEASGRLRLRALPGYDLEADYLMAIVAEDIEVAGIRRLVLDSSAQLERSIGEVERVPGFLAALVSFLRARQVTTYLTMDLPVSGGLDFGGTPLSVFADNLIIMRELEYEGKLRPVISVVKMRFSAHDSAIYEYTIEGGQGLRIVGAAPLSQGLLAGVAPAVADVTHQAGRKDR